MKTWCQFSETANEKDQVLELKDSLQPLSSL